MVPYKYRFQLLLSNLIASSAETIPISLLSTNQPNLWHLMLQQDTSCVLGSVGKTIFLIVHCWIICAVLFLFHSCLQDELFLMTENTFLYHPWSDSAGISFFCDASNKCINIWFGRMEKYITYTKKNQHIFLIHHVYGNPIISQNFLHGI